MDIQQIIQWDKQLLLALNGSDSSVLDSFMMTHTGTWVWIPFFLALLYVIAKNNKWQETLLIVCMIALVVLLADRISSGLFKPLFHRFRPTHDPEIMALVDVVNNYRGGKYGFVSSHAANSFGIVTFFSLLFRRKELMCGLIFWATLHCYSRIYLGVHFPGDILCGALLGVLVGWGVYGLYSYLHKRFLTVRYAHVIARRSNKYTAADLYPVWGVFALTYLFLVVRAFIG